MVGKGVVTKENHWRDDLNTSAGDRKTTMNKNDWKDFGENSAVGRSSIIKKATKNG